MVMLVYVYVTKFVFLSKVTLGTQLGFESSQLLSAQLEILRTVFSNWGGNQSAGYPDGDVRTGHVSVLSKDSLQLDMVKVTVNVQSNLEKMEFWIYEQENDVLCD